MINEYIKDEAIIGISFEKNSICCSYYYADTELVRNIKNTKGECFSNRVVIDKNNLEILYEENILNDWDDLSDNYYIINSLFNFINENHNISINDKNLSSKSIMEFVFNYISNTIEKKIKSPLKKVLLSFEEGMNYLARDIIKETFYNMGITIIHVINSDIASLYNTYNNLENYKKILVVNGSFSKTTIKLVDNTGEFLIEDIKETYDLSTMKFKTDFVKLIHNELMNEGYVDKIYYDMDLFEQYKLMFKFCNIEKLLLKRPVVNLSITNYGNAIGIIRQIKSDKYLKLINEYYSEIKLLIEKFLLSNSLTLNDISYVHFIGEYFDSKYNSLNINIIDNKASNFGKVSLFDSSNGVAKLGVYSGNTFTTEAINIILADDNLFEIVPNNTMLDSIDKEFIFAVTNDSLKANFIFYNDNGKLLKELDVDIFGFLKEKIIVDVYSDIMNVINIRICSDRKKSKEATKFSYIAPKIKYQLPKVVYR